MVIYDTVVDDQGENLLKYILYVQYSYTYRQISLSVLSP